MTTKHEVISVYALHPNWSSIRIARELACCDAYVRATLKRNGLKLYRRPPTAEVYELGNACVDAGITLSDLHALVRSRAS